VSETLPGALSHDERSQIVAACERLSLDYSYYADAGRMDVWSELFAEDAELVVGGVAQCGRAAIIESVSGPRGEIQSIHAISNVRIDVVSATKAVGLAYITAYMAPKTKGSATMAAIAPAVVGIYEDAYCKTADGWLFARRAFSPLISDQLA
jgi:hypothetical protein